MAKRTNPADHLAILLRQNAKREREYSGGQNRIGVVVRARPLAVRVGKIVFNAASLRISRDVKLDDLIPGDEVFMGSTEEGIFVVLARLRRVGE